MYNLTFDTTGSSCGIILQNDSDVISVYEKTMDFGQSEELMVQIEIMFCLFVSAQVRLPVFVHQYPPPEFLTLLARS